VVDGRERSAAPRRDAVRTPSAHASRGTLAPRLAAPAVERSGRSSSRSARSRKSVPRGGARWRLRRAARRRHVLERRVRWRRGEQMRVGAV